MNENGRNVGEGKIQQGETELLDETPKKRKNI